MNGYSAETAEDGPSNTASALICSLDALFTSIQDGLRLIEVAGQLTPLWGDE